MSLYAGIFRQKSPPSRSRCASVSGSTGGLCVGSGWLPFVTRGNLCCTRASMPCLVVENSARRRHPAHFTAILPTSAWPCHRSRARRVRRRSPGYTARRPCRPLRPPPARARRISSSPTTSPSPRARRTSPRCAPSASSSCSPPRTDPRAPVRPPTTLAARRPELLALAGDGRVLILHLDNLPNLQPLQALLAAATARRPLRRLPRRPLQPRAPCAASACGPPASAARASPPACSPRAPRPATTSSSSPASSSPPSTRPPRRPRARPGHPRSPASGVARRRRRRLVPLLRALTPPLRERGLSRVYELECRLLPSVLAMEDAGVGLDVPGFERMVSGWQHESATAAPAPERVAQLDKLLSTYAHWPTDFADDDGRLHPHLHPLATDSGRFACSQPNLQQVPAEHTAPGMRACFVPAPGHRLHHRRLRPDRAARRRPARPLRRHARQVFRAGRDPHRATAADPRPQARVRRSPRTSASSPRPSTSASSSAWAPAASRSTEIQLRPRARPPRRRAVARDAFFATFPGIAAWHRRIGALEGRSQREPITVHTALGRRKRFLPATSASTPPSTSPCRAPPPRASSGP
jgi:hypothetical protein